MKLSVVKVTPEIARMWLGNNDRNRNINERLVQEYARDMANGRWVSNGETVKLSDTGQLLDGQHRLSAVAMSGATVEMVVIEGLPSEAQDTMDAGRKRSMGDVLSINGVTNAHILASVGRRVWQWEQGNFKFTNTQTPSQSEIYDLIRNSPRVHRSAEVAQRTYDAFRLAKPSVTGTVHYITTGIDPGQAAEFFSQLAVGADISKDYPVLTLRNRLMLDKAMSKHVPFQHGVAMYIRAWNAVRENRSLAKIMQGVNDPMPMPV